MKNLSTRTKKVLAIAGLVIVVVVAGLVLLGPSGAGLFGASDLTITTQYPFPWTKGEVHRLVSNTVWDCNWAVENSGVVNLLEPAEYVKTVQAYAVAPGTTTVKSHCGFLHTLTASITVTVEE